MSKLNRLTRAVNSTSRALSTSTRASTSTLPPTPAPSPTHAPSAQLPPRGTRLYSPSAQKILNHLQGVLEPYGCTLAEQDAVTAITAKGGLQIDSGEGHNARMSFLGRRILRLHLTLFLSDTLAASPILLATQLSQTSIDRFLDTKELGAGPGRAWGLEEVMRWREVRGQNGEPSGLYKTRGTALEALIGAVYLRHGIKASSRLFKTSVLPHLSLPRGIKEIVEVAVREAKEETF